MAQLHFHQREKKVVKFCRETLVCFHTECLLGGCHSPWFSCFRSCFLQKEHPVGFAFLPAGWQDNAEANTQECGLYIAKDHGGFLASNMGISYILWNRNWSLASQGFLAGNSDPSTQCLVSAFFFPWNFWVCFSDPIIPAFLYPAKPTPCGQCLQVLPYPPPAAAVVSSPRLGD